MTVLTKNFVLRINIPWKAALISMEYGNWETKTCFWLFAFFLRIPGKDAPKRTRILFRNYRRQYRLLTGQKMPLNAKSF